jgi:twitching motility protein PilT
VFGGIPSPGAALAVLGWPRVFGAPADRPRGLVLVTGPTGSGKSTTLAAMVDRINSSKPVHILTIEDPIEFVHTHKAGLVNQRELHTDTDSWAAALRAALREDPDVVLVGEMRDTETMAAALTLAETGHLTLASLHTNSAAQTITRIVDAFPAHQQAQIRVQLSLVLEGVVCQTLVLHASGNGRVAALEILIASPAIRHLIREDKVHQIYGVMQVGQAQAGTQTMNQALARLVERRAITRETALRSSSSRDELAGMLERPMAAAVARS